MSEAGTQLQLLRQSLAKRWPSAFSVAEVARRVGVNERTYRRWETGEDHPRRRHIRALSHEFGFKPVDDSPEALEAAAELAALGVRDANPPIVCRSSWKPWRINVEISERSWRAPW